MLQKNFRILQKKLLNLASHFGSPRPIQIMWFEFENYENTFAGRDCLMKIPTCFTDRESLRFKRGPLKLESRRIVSGHRAVCGFHATLQVDLWFVSTFRSFQCTGDEQEPFNLICFLKSSHKTVPKTSELQLLTLSC